MDWKRIERDWGLYRLTAKLKWCRLSDNELKQINGKRDDLCAKIQQAYGISRYEAELQIADWVNEQDDPTRGEQHDSIQHQSQSQSQTLR